MRSGKPAWVEEVIKEVIPEEYLADVYVDEIGGEIVIEVYDSDGEIMTPEVVGQHGMEVDEDFYKNWLSDEEVKRIKEECIREWGKVKAEGYIGTLEDYIIERLDAIAIKRWEREIDEEIRKWESQPSRTVNYKGYPIRISPAVIEKKCYINIPHYHLFKGYIVAVPIVSMEEEVDEETRDLQRELLEYAWNLELEFP